MVGSSLMQKAKTKTVKMLLSDFDVPTTRDDNRRSLVDAVSEQLMYETELRRKWRPG